MRIQTNQRAATRNASIGKWSMGIGIFLMVGGALAGTQTTLSPLIILGGLAGGWMFSQIGMYFTNHWGGRPRPEERINASLKGLPREYRLYHYFAPCPHLLVGPAGVWAITHYHQFGTITYVNGRWRQRGGGLLLAYLKIFAQEGLGRPDLDAQVELQNLREYLAKELGEGAAPPINVALVFTNPRVRVEAENAPVPTLRADGLKDFLRRQAREHALPAAEIERIAAVLPQADQ